MPLLMQMSPEDREKYGGPEWLSYDAGKLDDTPCDELAAIEDATGVVLFNAVATPAAATSIRLWLWLALRDAGVDVAWPQFTPKTLRVRVRAGDADPPASAGRRSAGRSAKASAS